MSAHDRMVEYARAFISAAEDPNVTSSSNGYIRAAHVTAILKHVKDEEDKGDREALAVYHECLSVHYYRMGDMKACKEHMNLAMDWMDLEPPKCVPLRACQTLGWISMARRSSDLQLSYVYGTLFSKKLCNFRS